LQTDEICIPYLLTSDQSANFRHLGRPACGGKTTVEKAHCPHQKPAEGMMLPSLALAASRVEDHVPLLDDSAAVSYNDFMKKVLSREWLSTIPKVEIHLHLEGAIPMPGLWELIQKYGGDSDIRSQEALQRRFIYSDFSHFIQTWVWKNKFIREYEDFDFIAMSVAEDLKSQNIRYVEAFISPPDFVRHGLETGRIIESVRRGLNRVAGIEVNLVVDLVRDYGESRALATLDATIDARRRSRLDRISCSTSNTDRDVSVIQSPNTGDFLYRRTSDPGFFSIAESWLPSTLTI